MGISVFPTPASGPTLAQITAAGNSAGWGTVKGPLDVTWTNIAFQAGSGSNTITFSSIGSYKKLKLVLAGINSDNSTIAVTFNGDSSTNYQWQGFMLYNATNAGDNLRSGTGAGSQSFQIGASSSGVIEAELLIENAADTTPHKHVQFYQAGYENGARSYREARGVYRGTSAISSISIARSVGFSTTSPFGFYLYGAN